MGIICTIIEITLHNLKFNTIWEILRINFSVIVSFLYMISFVGLISKASNKKDIYTISIFSIISIYLLYKANKPTYMYIIWGIYLILTFFKLQTLPKTKNRRILKNISIIILAIYILNIYFYQLERLPYREIMDYAHLQERVIDSKMFGKAELKADLQEDAYTQYVYTNFSDYSFVYLIENYGKICGIFIIGLFMFLLIKLIFNYKQVKDNYGKMLNLGIGCFLFIPSIISFLTRIGIANFPSVNMPFLTHNEISIIIYMISISLIMSIYSRKNIDIISTEKIQNNV